MARITRENTDIEFKVAGNGATTLLFVHGSYMDQESWKAQADHFKPDYRVVTMDLAGHGKSGRDRKRWSLRGFAQDVAAVMDMLSTPSIVLIGHSMAGDINLIAADIHPQSVVGFIGVDTFRNAGMPLPEAYREQAKAILENLKEDFSGTNERYARMALLTPSTPPAIVKRVVEAYRNAYPPMGQAIMPEVFAMDAVERELLPRLKRKLYLINADYMPTQEEPLRRLCRGGFELARIQGTCHYPMLENPDALNTALERALRKIREDVPVFA
jgi:pimeloyl-ACP methyl ester carboxylesterase